MKPFSPRVAATVAVAAVLSTACSTPRPALSAPPVPPPAAYHVGLAKTGEVAVRRGDADSLFSIRPSLFEPGWANRAAAFDNAANALRIVAANGNVVTVVPTVTATGKIVTVSAAFTADKDTPVNSLQLSASLPITAYVGGAAVFTGADGKPQTFTIPAVVGANRITEGANGSLALAKKDGTGAVTFNVVGDSTVLIQDNRVFGSTELEVRVGRLSPHTLKAGVTETITFTMTLPGAASAAPDAPLVLQAGTDWIPLAPASLDIAAGSALDFSAFLADAPAGKYGRMIATPAGHFAFVNRARPQRFYGTNLCFSANYLDHAQADRLADRLMRLGYNAVRIHHYESELVDSSAPDSLTLRSDSFDKLDYLVAALKKRGIYLTTDLFVSRPVKPAEMGLEAGATADDFKDAILVSPPAMANWKAFSKEFLAHVNPYTKLAYKDEPALAWISVVNEPGLSRRRLAAMKGRPRDLYEAEWKTWYAQHYAKGTPAPALPANADDPAAARLLDAFVAFIHQRGYDEMSGFLRREVVTKALLTYLNNSPQDLPFAAVRQSLDYVDNHFYWDHPNFLGNPWQLPSTGWSGNGSAAAAGGAGPDGIALTRLYGKPFAVTEWDYVAPNRYRAEGSLIMGAVSSVQDWDAIWHFAYAHSREAASNPVPDDYFNVAEDPLRQASERTGILLFLRGDAGVGRATTSSDVPPRLLQSLTDMTASGYAFVRSDVLSGRVGTNLSGAHVPQVREQSEPRTLGQQITLNADAGQFAVATDNTVALTLNDGTDWQRSGVSVRADGARAMVAVSSLDGLPIATSKHLLVTHLTDLQNTGERFASPERRVIEDWGHLPYLVRTGTAEVSLMRSDGRAAKAWRLDTTGVRAAALPVHVDKRGATVALSTRAPDGSATLYYEVVFP